MPTSMPQVQVTPGYATTLFDSGSVAAGAAIDSGALNTSQVMYLWVWVGNTGGNATRAISLIDCQDDSAALNTTALGNANSGSNYLTTIGPTGVLTNRLLLNRTQFQLASGGTGPARMIIIGR